MKALRWLTIPLIIALLIVVGMFLNPPREAGRGDVAWGQPQGAGRLKAVAPNPPGKGDPVVATVNGEPIRESDLALKLPKGSFGLEEGQAREEKLDRLIDAVEMRQFLRKEKIEVSESEIDADVADLRKNPPTAGCPCCRYQSLEQFMEANNLDMKELREILANDLGLAKYLALQWEKEFPPGDARKKRVDAERPRIEESYLKVSHVFFKTYQNPDFATKPDEVRKTVGAKARAAWELLSKGKGFDAVAREISEDAVSAPKGGALGCIPTYAFGKDFAVAVAALKPGEYSKPLESPWGFHIVRRDVMDDNDVADLLKAEWMDVKQSDVANDIRENAKVTR